MPSRWKLAMAAAMKAKRSWERIPPEQRRRILDGAKTTVQTKGPIVAQKAADTAKTHGPVIAQRAAETAQKATEAARAQAPVVARRIAAAIEKARKSR